MRLFLQTGNLLIIPSHLRIIEISRYELISLCLVGALVFMGDWIKWSLLSKDINAEKKYATWLVFCTMIKYRTDHTRFAKQRYTWNNKYLRTSARLEGRVSTQIKNDLDIHRVAKSSELYSYIFTFVLYYGIPLLGTSKHCNIWDYQSPPLTQHPPLFQSDERRNPQCLQDLSILVTGLYGPVFLAAHVSMSPPQQQQIHLSLFAPFLWHRISPGSVRALPHIIISRGSHGRRFQRLGPHCGIIERSGPASCISSAYPKHIHPH